MTPVTRFAPDAGEPTASGSWSRPGISVTVRDDVHCVLCTAAVDAGTVAGPLANALAAPLPERPGTVCEQDGRRILWLGPRSWLVLCSENDESDVLASVHSAFHDRAVLASRYSDHYRWFELAGDQVDDTLRLGGFITFEPGGLPLQYAKRTLIAGVSVLLETVSENVWHVGIERSRAGYFLEWLESLEI